MQGVYPLADEGYGLSSAIGGKGHYGVALMCRQKPQDIFYGFPDDGEEAQRRMIGLRLLADDGDDIERLLPTGENVSHRRNFPIKRTFTANSQVCSTNLRADERLAIMGDFNISPEDQDIGIEQAKRWLREGEARFQPIEREIVGIKAWGLTDSYRLCYPENNERFSWFDYRSKGFDRSPTWPTNRLSLRDAAACRLHSGGGDGL